jgi:tyrosyl-tRNA synthetase
MGSVFSGVRMRENIFENPPRRVLWGIAPTGEPHFGYILPLLVMKRLKKLGSTIVPLIANWHGYLDSRKTEWAEIEERTRHYRRWFESVGFPDAVETSAFYTKADYVELLFKASPFFKLEECLDACATTVKAPRKEQTAAEIIYTITQIIDILYLDIDCALCGEDEAPIYEYGLPVLARELGHACGGAYVRLAPGLIQNEMHASTGKMNKMTLSDSAASLREKIAGHLRGHPATAGSPPLLEFLAGPVAELMPPCEELRALQEKPAGDLTDLLTRAVVRVFDEVRSKPV